jgi:hypothetical protein
VEDPPTCPRCDVEFVTGQLSIKGTMPGFVFVGFSWQHLWWTSTDGSRERLLDSGERCTAGECPSCGLVAFMPPRRRV